MTGTQTADWLLETERYRPLTLDEGEETDLIIYDREQNTAWLQSDVWVAVGAAIGDDAGAAEPRAAERGESA